MSKYKLAIVMRTDLEMGKGKMCVQAGHASIKAYVEASNARSQIVDAWLHEGQFKVVVKAKSEQELNEINEKAHALGLEISLVYDFGFTQVAPNTLTCIAIGPALVEEIDKITGNLPLL
jgi:PTH2 family peptidyl-tRNA hydrolase